MMKLKLFALLLVFAFAGTVLAPKAVLAQDDKPAKQQDTFETFAEAMQAGLDELQAQNFEEARNAFSSALALAGNGLDKALVQLQIGLAYDAESKHEQARAQYQKVREAVGVPATLRTTASVRVGISYLSEGKYDLARASFVEIAESNDTDTGNRATAFLNIGYAYSQEQKWAQAREEYAKILTLDRVSVLDKALSLNYIAKAYFGEGEPAQARQQLELLLALDAKDLPSIVQRSFNTQKQRAQLGIGQSFFIEKNYARAKGEYEKVLEMEKLDPHIKADAEKQLAAIAQLSKAEGQK